MWPWEEKPRILDHLLSQQMNEKQPSSGWSCQSADHSVRWEANLGLCILLSNLCWLFPCFPWRAQSRIHFISVFQQYFENLASLFFSCYFIQEMFFSYSPQRRFHKSVTSKVVKFSRIIVTDSPIKYVLKQSTGLWASEISGTWDDSTGVQRLI